nr:CBS domain-containing protein [Peptoniphilus indolicus]
MSIFDNIVMVPRLLKWDETKLRAIAENLIERVDLPKEYLDRYPSELSGGQQQRIGVIRALAADQDIILMDEPFGALDPITRNSLQQLVKSLQKEMGKTVIFVTHDMDEALQLSDKIVIMDKGHVIQIGSPENILKNPATEYVKELLGEEKLNEAKTSYNTVETIMLKNPVHANLHTTTLEAIRLMRNKRVDTLFVTDDDGVLLGHIGIFDLVKIGKRNVPLRTILTKSHPILNSTKVIEAIHQIYKLKVKNLPVVDSKRRLVGIVTRASIVDTIYENLWSEDDIVEDIIDTSSSDELKKLTEEAQVNLND